jgi:HAD superfamily hydrolase (TIGR01549 family)
MNVPEKAMHEFPTVFNQLYLESLNYVKLFPDVKECLTTLRQRGIKLGLVSATPSELLWPALNELKLVSFFKVIIGNAPKPSPLPIYQACKIIGIEPKCVVYVGDMEEDMICARRAGAIPVAICRENGNYHDKTKLEAQNPTYVINDLRELVSLVKQNNESEAEVNLIPKRRDAMFLS